VQPCKGVKATKQVEAAHPRARNPEADYKRKQRKGLLSRRIEESAGYSRLEEGVHQQQTLLAREVQRLIEGVLFQGKTAPPF
jgi:hypothetical protein